MSLNEDKLFKKIATEVKGLPTSVILYKRSDGMYMAPMVGFTGAEEFRKNGRHFLRDYTRFAPRHGN